MLLESRPMGEQLIAVKQSILARKGYYLFKVDGVSGPGTNDAVTRCKAAHGLMARPDIGPLTDSLISVANEANIIPWDDVPSPIADSDPSGAPPMLIEARKHLGVREWAGRDKYNPAIKKWADELKAAGALDWYPDDDIAWCGMFHGMLALRCHPNLKLPPNILSSRNWGGRDYPGGVFKSAADEPGWGVNGPNPAKGEDIPLGCTGNMWTGSINGDWRGHIGIVSAQNATHIRLVGGNQSNSVSEAWYPRSRFLGTRLVPGLNYVSAPAMKTGATGQSTF
jgi:hypothetical protein